MLLWSVEIGGDGSRWRMEVTVVRVCFVYGYREKMRIIFSSVMQMTIIQLDPYSFRSIFTKMTFRPNSYYDEIDMIIRSRSLLAFSQK